MSAAPAAVESLVAADRERCMDLAQRVGWPRETAKWQLLFHVGRGYGIRDQDRAGALSAMVVIPALEGASFVAMMVVDPAQQGRGLGKRLLEHALAEATRPVLLYATALGRPLYQRLGFHEIDSAQKHIGVPHATRAHAAVRAATAADHAAIIREDARAFGFGRTRLIENLLARAERAVASDDGGFALRWSNGHLAVVGPIVASSQEVAIQLCDAALEGCTGPARVDVARASPNLVAHVRSLGLAGLDPAPLMMWPTAELPGDRSRYHALALQAFG